MGLPEQDLARQQQEGVAGKEARGKRRAVEAVVKIEPQQRGGG